MTSEVFLDTSFVIASTSDRDQYHARAMDLNQELQIGRTRIITTTGVLLEVGNSLAKSRSRHSATQAIESLLHDPTVELVQVGQELFARAFELYQRRSDKEWGLVDCLSFVVMWDRSVTEALTSDEHFEQAGFIALLR